MVVRGRLWRVSNPALAAAVRLEWVTQLMAARREIRQASGDPIRIAEARKAVHQSKLELGERGPVWWDDGSPDYNRHMAVNTPYADWFQTLKSRDDPYNKSSADYEREAGSAPGGSTGPRVRRKRRTP